jgi:hypothetical protein
VCVVRLWWLCIGCLCLIFMFSMMMVMVMLELLLAFVGNHLLVGVQHNYLTL